MHRVITVVIGHAVRDHSGVLVECWADIPLLSRQVFQHDDLRGMFTCRLLQTAQINVLTLSIGNNLAFPVRERRIPNTRFGEVYH
jgi:hypothetical protein